MEAELYSSSLAEFNAQIENPALWDSLVSLRNILQQDFKVLVWDDTRIAVPVALTVDLPSLGNYGGIDIQRVEPVIIVFDLIEYPSTSPIVFTDRLDFPKDKLAHLYIAVNGKPPAFCYVRGNSDEWYANKRISDLIVRMSNWLRDAAAGELTQDGAQFEPLRMERCDGTLIYDYDLLASVIHGNQSLFSNTNYTIALFERLKNDDARSYKFVKVLTAENIKSVIEEFDKEKKKDKAAADKKIYHYGYVLWNPAADVFPNYEIDFPEDWDGFKAFCKNYQIDYSGLEETVGAGDGNDYVSFPVIVAIKRPNDLIGFSSNVEFVNFRFLIDTDDIADGKITVNKPVKVLLHNQPLTTAKAKIISGLPLIPADRSVVFGCGALGSKIVLHIARSGKTEFTLVDPDYLAPHNLVRHGLFADDEAANKAKALGEKIKSIFPIEKTGVVSGPSYKDGLFEKPETFEKSKWIMDFTASEAFFNRLVMTKSMDSNQIFSANISDFGNLGILYKEGTNRNPRLDDLQAALYSEYKTDNIISQWLVREKAANSNSNLIVEVGVGCNSETTILADDKVSSHAAYFSGAIKSEMAKSSTVGKISLSWISEENDYSITSQTISVKPFDVLPALNDRSWTTRFKEGILDQIKKESVKAKKNETGGVFTGLINYKTKTIHVTGLIAAPPDSKANSICFFRGHLGLPEQIKNITDGSGGQIGYIGEWHSHPKGPNGLSDVDMFSVAKHKAEFSRLPTPIPVFLAVVTPAGILPFVF